MGSWMCLLERLHVLEHSLERHRPDPFRQRERVLPSVDYVDPIEPEALPGRMHGAWVAGSGHRESAGLARRTCERSRAATRTSRLRWRPGRTEGNHPCPTGGHWRRARPRPGRIPPARTKIERRQHDSQGSVPLEAPLRVRGRTLLSSTSGHCSATSRSRIVAPSGSLFPCSHARTVSGLTFNAAAKTGWERAIRSRIPLIRLGGYWGGGSTRASDAVYLVTRAGVASPRSIRTASRADSMSRSPNDSSLRAFVTVPPPMRLPTFEAHSPQPV